LNVSGMLEVILWSSILLVFWTYFGYFLLMKAVSYFYAKDVKRENIQPNVSLIITAYNEERRIAEKIENSLASSYPADKLEIIIVSDASNDNTDNIVRSYSEKGVKLLVMPERHGKHYGQGRGIKAAKSDIVVLTDATTFLDADSIQKIVRNFADPTVGCVSGVDSITSDDANASGEGLYVKYEMALRDLESMVGSLIGVSGCFFAVRKRLCVDWIDNMSADFYMPNIAYENGFRSILDKEAIGRYTVLHNPEKEFQRKVRTVVHGLEVLFRFKRLMSIFRFGTYSIQLISHKLLRWLVPFLLLEILVVNALLYNGTTAYFVLFILQVLFYILALTTHMIPSLRNYTLLKIPYFFTMVNYAILIAWYKYITYQEYVVWDSTKR